MVPELEATASAILQEIQYRIKRMHIADGEDWKPDLSIAATLAEMYKKLNGPDHTFRVDGHMGCGEVS